MPTQRAFTAPISTTSGLKVNSELVIPGALKFEVQHFSEENVAWEITINSVLKSAVLYRRS